MRRYEEKELQQEMELVEKYLSEYLRDPGYGSSLPFSAIWRIQKESACVRASY